MKGEPDNTAARVALWRAYHLQADDPPPVLADDIGLKLLDPPPGWQDRPDVGSPFVKPFRASILARARFIEDRVTERAAAGVNQYVLLGAGLDSFAQRRPSAASRVTVFEIDQPATQTWKRQRLAELDLGMDGLRLVPVNFELQEAWWEQLVANGFDPARPAVVASTGVSMYLSRAAVADSLRQMAGLAKGSTLVMSFLLPLDMADPDIRPGMEAAARGAAAAGTPFISFFTPDEMLALARECGLRTVSHVSAQELGDRYFADRTDGLRPPRNAEELLVATV